MMRRGKEHTMNRFARILALSLAAVAVFGCETQDKVDQGGVIVVISDYDIHDLPAVMSVAMMPGCTSNTKMPNSASRSAYSVVIMLIAALLRQYSPRAGLLVKDEIELVLQMRYTRSGWAFFCSTIQLAILCVRKYGPRRLIFITRS